MAELRARVGVPLVPMTYAAPVLAHGELRFCADAAAAGADGLIVPDLPHDEAGELLEGCRLHGLDLVPLLAPTSTDERIALACAAAGGFVYLVSVAGITGSRDGFSQRVAPLVERVRGHTELPLLVGFGISSPARRPERRSTPAPTAWSSAPRRSRCMRPRARPGWSGSSPAWRRLWWPEWPLNRSSIASV